MLLRVLAFGVYNLEDSKNFHYKVDTYTHVSHFSKHYGIETKLHRLVPHGKTSHAMYLVLELDAWLG